jgi:glutathione S-transferase
MTSARTMTVIESSPRCGATPRVLFALEEIGDAYELLIREDGYFLSSFGVPGPCLVEDGEFRLLEASAILRYLGRTRSLGKLIPRQPRPQAEVDRFIDLVVLRLGLSLRYGQMDAVKGILEVLERQLEGRDWLCGEFSAADCGAIPIAIFADRLPLEPLPRLRAYRDRLVARPAWQRARARLEAGA